MNTNHHLLANGRDQGARPGEASPVAVRVFFGHQSVGANVLDGLPAACAERDLPPLPVRPLSGAEAEDRAVVLHAPLGVNGDPRSKIAAFDALVRGGVGDRVDVALMKLCYADVTSRTDVDAVFDAYVTALDRLERDYPHVTFLHTTTPLTTLPGVRSRLRKLLGRDPHVGAADNAAREQLNIRIRCHYQVNQIFDLAVVESTKPSGRRSSGRYRGQPCPRLWRGYAADPGHLNAAGAAAAAAELLDVLSVVHDRAA